MVRSQRKGGAVSLKTEVKLIEDSVLVITRETMSRWAIKWADERGTILRMMVTANDKPEALTKVRATWAHLSSLLGS
jgi:hypothetical protein